MNPVLFADLPAPTSMELGGWMLCLFAFLGAVNQAYKAKQNLFGEKGKTEISPYPLSVQMAQAFATDAECKARHDREGKRIFDLSKEIELQRLERARDVKSADESRAALYSRIEEVRKELSHHGDETRRELSEKIDQLPAQLIATLRNSRELF